MNKYQEAVDKAIREFEIDLEEDCYNEWLKREVEDLKEVKSELEKLEEKNARYKTLEQELGCPIENNLALFLIYKNQKYYFKYKDKIYECDNIYINNMHYNEKFNAFIDVSTNNKELHACGIYNVILYAEDYGKIWWLEESEIKD